MNKQRGFIIPPFFLSPTGMMVTAIAVLSVTNAITYKLWRSEVEDYANYKAVNEAHQRALEEEAERRRIASEQSSREDAKNWVATVEYWQRRAASGGGIRVQPVRCEGGLRPVPVTPTGTGQATPQPEFSSYPTITVEQCEGIANNAVLDAAQVEHLRAWVAHQRAASIKNAKP